MITIDCTCTRKATDEDTQMERILEPDVSESLSRVYSVEILSTLRCPKCEATVVVREEIERL